MTGDGPVPCKFRNLSISASIAAILASFCSKKPDRASKGHVAMWAASSERLGETAQPLAECRHRTVTPGQIHACACFDPFTADEHQSQAAQDWLTGVAALDTSEDVCAIIVV